MDSSNSIQTLAAARDVLRSGIENSRSIGIELERASSRLGEMARRLSIRPPRISPSWRCYSALAVEDRVSCGIQPAAAALKALKTVRGLEVRVASASGSGDLTAYLSLVKSLEQALKFLENNSRLAIQWLQGVAEFLEENGLASDRLVSNVKRSLIILRWLERAGERSHLNGGAMDAAFVKMEDEFERLLEAKFAPLGPESSDGYENIHNEAAIMLLQALVERLSSNRRLEKCLNTYAAVRSRKAISSLQPLDLNYLNEPLEEEEEDDDNNQTSVEARIRRWSEDLKFAVKGVLRHEHKLCVRVFEGQPTAVATGCFVEVANRSGISQFIRFGRKVTEGRKSPGKLLSLLEVFSALDDLRPEFTVLFGGVAGATCEKIQAQTRELVKRVVEGSWDIFWELSYQVELRRSSPPPSDGSIPRLVSFVTDYCNLLLEETYRPTLIKTMEIYLSWKRESYHPELLANQIYSILKEVELNLDVWAKGYGPDNRPLSWLFMMNNHGHFGSLRGSKLGDMMGESWVAAHEQYRDYYGALYANDTRYHARSIALIMD
ncbi:hypothetical protein SAY87_006603 [Trapa incisa]|uniref:Exocyst subunit Exo70 family protein n=1 Tax=Trapa incisa TaxID=236973 RepID=A0AAN7JYX9_9MYRT|nr:hypothetical protein SAY87_006603 [Trapa incisa]